MSRLKQRLLFAFVICSLLLMLALGVKRGNTQTKPKQDESSAVAIRTGGLREAARIKGHYEGTVRTTGWGKFDLDALTSNSSNVIIGIPTQSSSAIAGSTGERIETTYKVKVESVLKGDAASNMNVVIQGGKVVFDDGTSAEIVAEDLGPIIENQKYLFFLKPTSSNTFVITGGGQGLFELNDDKVKPRGHRTDIVQKHKDEPVTEFVNEVKTAVKKYPGMSSCCK